MPSTTQLIVEPRLATLQKYGLTLTDWHQILVDQGGVCGVCGKVPSSGRFVVDHKHVRGWKNMDPADRRQWVRGILCNSCNHFIISRYMTPEKADGAARYLRAFEERRREAPQ